MPFNQNATEIAGDWYVGIVENEIKNLAMI
jgi:hypothetical protein